MRPKRDDGRQEIHEGPDLQRLTTDYRAAVNNRDTNYWERQRINYESRYCLWTGQSWDGRKWNGIRGKKPFPWKGASDARVPLVDKYIREDAATLMQIWIQQKVLARPTQPQRDAAWAARTTALLRWQLYQEMEESEDEAELLANLMLERGAAALGIWWCREEQLTRETLTLEDINKRADIAMQQLRSGRRGDALELAARLPQMIMDPASEQEVASLVQGMVGESKSLTPKRILKVVRDLRNTGEAHFPRAIIAKDRPVIRAMAWNEDVVLPAEAVDVQRAREVFVRELLTETDLESRQRSYGYESAWVDRVIETQRGKFCSDPTELSANRGSALGRGEPITKDLFEVITAYQRLYDEDGIQGVWCTVFSPGMGNERDPQPGKHELLDYAHGQYPIIPFSLERRSRLVDDSRGYGERAFTMQNQVKRQWDARVDYSDVSTLPPSYHPPEEEPDAWGPGVKIGTVQADKFGYFDAPKPNGGSQEIEETVRKFADEYFGRPVDEQNTVEARALKMDLTRVWLKGWKRAATQILQLNQQYLPDEVYVRVVGSEQGRTMRITREEIQGPFNVVLHFNSDDFDKELVAEKIGFLQTVIGMDLSGRIDRDEAVAAAFELVDPWYAERLLKPAQAAAVEQIDDEQTVLVKLLLGIGVDVKGDEAAGLRKQVLEQTVQGSPTVQKLLEVNPQARELVERRYQQLDFQVQQKSVNPDIGRRLGSKPMSAANPATEAPIHAQVPQV